MKRKTISSGSPFEKSIGFSRAVRDGSIVAVSGTAPIGDDGKTAHPGDAYQQAFRCLSIIARAIEEAGSRLEDVIRTRIYLTEVSNWEAVGKAHGEFFGEIRPASTMVVVKALLCEDWLVEIEADCLIR